MTAARNLVRRKTGFADAERAAQLVGLFDPAFYAAAYPDIAAARCDPLLHFLEVGWAEGRNPCALFDINWYFEQNPDVVAAGVNPLAHYLGEGWREGRCPHPLFDVGWYLEGARDVRDASAEPLAHFINQGWREARSPHPLFEMGWYLANNQDVAADGINPLTHYLAKGWRDGRDPGPAFASAWYLEQNPELAPAGICPLVHYVTIGWRKDRSPHPLFDVKGYIETNPDVAAARIEPLRHFTHQGWREGRQPHALFDTNWYLSRNADVAEAGIDPFTHYLTTGWREGRRPHPLFDGAYYLATHDEVRLSGREPLEDYVRDGWREGRRPHPLFDGDRYLDGCAEARATGKNPLEHYVTQGWRTGCSPHPLFDAAWYLQRNADVAAAGAEPLRHFIETGWIEGRDPSRLFDVGFYLEGCREEIAASGIDPLTHYVTIGWRAGRSPNALFDADFYRRRSADIDETGDEKGEAPLVHFVERGAGLGFSPHWLFDPLWYLGQAPSTEPGGADPLSHYLDEGWKAGASPHPLFDVDWYRGQRPGAAPPDAEPLRHFLTAGRREGLTAHPLFDADFYRRQTPDLEASAIDPLDHYLETGWRAGLNPHPLFDAAWYVAKNPDARQADAAPLIHYLTTGWRQGASPHPLFDAAWYGEQEGGGPSPRRDPLSRYLSGGWREGRTPHVLFDGAWYLARNADVAEAGIDPFTHYLTTGWREGQNPHPLFDAAYYKGQAPVSRGAAVDPLRHYLEQGWRRGLKPHPAFDAAWYLESNPEVKAAGAEPFSHYLRSGWRDGRSPHPLFDVKWYIETNLDVWRGKGEPLRHYETVGGAAGRSPHPMFDAGWYFQRYPDAQAHGATALVHYLTIGAKQGLTPHPLFDAAAYLATYPDIAASGADPYLHYLLKGWREGREPHAAFDGKWYLGQYPEVKARACNPLADYALGGWKEGRDPNPHFDTAWYLDQNPDIRESGVEPLHHYLTSGWREGRDPNPQFDTLFYLDGLAGAMGADIDPLTHYLLKGRHENRATRLPPGLGAFERYGEYSARHSGPAVVLKEGDWPIECRFKGRIGVHLHLYYLDMIDGFLRALEAIPLAFDLYVSTIDCTDTDAVARQFRTVGHARSVAVENQPNRGRDIAPFVVGFGARLKTYDLLFHLHTKKSGHTAEKRDWADQLRHHLLHSRAHATRLLNLFADDARLGLVFPVFHPSIFSQVEWGADLEGANGLLTRFGPPAAADELRAFPAGSFFVARTEAIGPLLALDLSLEDFEEEAAQIDGTLAHSIERIWPIVVDRAGFRSVQVRAEKPHRLSTAYLKGDPYRSDFLDGVLRGEEIVARTSPLRHARGLRVGVFSCATGGYDQPLPFEALVEGATYSFFSDGKDAGAAPHWSVEPLAFTSADPVKAARAHKSQAHLLLPNVDIAVWIDANVAIVGDIGPLIDETISSGADFGVVAHPLRGTPFEEGERVVSLGLERESLVRRQLGRYRAEGYTGVGGLTETNFIIMDLRRSRTRAALDVWRQELADGSRRDQLSFDYALWRVGASKKALFDTGLSIRAHHAFANFPHGGWTHPAIAQRAPARAAGVKVKTVDVIVCVCDAADDVARCLRSVEIARDEKTRAIIVDDGSGAAARDAIERHARRNPGDIVLRNEASQGYTKSANAGLRRATADLVILLNSDTLVPQGWTASLARALDSDPGIGVIGPLSNAASWQSVPEALAADGDFAVNDLGPWRSVEDAAALCAGIDGPDVIDVPVVNGFCFGVRREVIGRIGLFDEAVFPEGYGEENDYCLRAAAAGFRCAVAAKTFVFHAKSKSFSHERRRQLSRQGWDKLGEKHGAAKIGHAVETLRANAALARVRASIAGKWMEGAREVLPIAFYLPQFHPIEVNDAAWGEGFTDWRNVARARPRFDAHFQPRLPGSLGFYDLRLSSVLAEQAALARAYGLYGFCVYYYRLGGRRLMAAPTEALRTEPAIPFRYFYCWANEDWTRAWDGRTSDTILTQDYAPETLSQIVEDLVEAIEDTRYIRIRDKPLFGVYQLDKIPGAPRFIEALREKVRARRGCDILVAATYNDAYEPGWNTLADMIVQFPPHRMPRRSPRRLIASGEVAGAKAEDADFFEAYDDVMAQSLESLGLIPNLVPGVCPDWDNSPRRAVNANILIGSAPEKFAHWVQAAAAAALNKHRAGDLCAPFVFVNAWNEWAEGAMLEPSERYGAAYLEALRAGLSAGAQGRSS